jgi:hypothetical protein
MIRWALGTILGGVLVLALVAFVPRAQAGELHQLTELTFNQPVQLPHNVVLPAGSYWFLVPDANAGQIVEIFNSHRTQLLGTFETVPTGRPWNRNGNTELILARTPNEVPTLVGWIYPGEDIGHEFVYSRRKERQFSEAGHLATVQIPNGGAVTIG